MAELKECDCKRKPIICNGGDHFWVKCYHCDKQTQIYKTAEQAVDAWNEDNK